MSLNFFGKIGFIAKNAINIPKLPLRPLYDKTISSRQLMPLPHFSSHFIKLATEMNLEMTLKKYSKTTL